MDDCREIMGGGGIFVEYIYIFIHIYRHFFARNSDCYMSHVCLFDVFFLNSWLGKCGRWNSFNFGSRYPISQGQLKIQTGLDGKVRSAKLYIYIN